MIEEKIYTDRSIKLYEIIKRVFDIIGSIVGLIITSPIILLFLLLIKIESPGKAIYSQERVGQDNKEFLMYKLRSMVCDAESNGAQWAEKNDNRITKVGRIIRMTRIDELPQLLNVLKGDMSIIGPRPERRVFIDEFLKKIPAFAVRTVVKPGLTGWAQVNGGYELNPEEKLVLDIYYINNRSIILDIMILIKTIKVIVFADGAR